MENRTYKRFADKEKWLLSPKKKKKLNKNKINK